MSTSTAALKHNTYFDGHVQSVGYERNGRRMTVGVIAPGEYHFGTEAPERMTVVSGELAVKDGTDGLVALPGRHVLRDRRPKRLRRPRRDARRVSLRVSRNRNPGRVPATSRDRAELVRRAVLKR